MPIRELTNVSGVSFTLTDFNGKLVQVDETFDGLAFGTDTLKSSVSVMQKILDGSLSLYDGYGVYTGKKAVDIIQYGGLQKYTHDGKPIIAVTDRPENTWSQLTSVADDFVNNTIGGGAHFEAEVSPGENEVIDMRWLEDVWIKEGSVHYLDASIGTHITLYAVAPPNVPYPVPNGNGTLDYDMSTETFVPNANGTGAYDINTTNNVAFQMFFSQKCLLGDGIEYVTLSDPFLAKYPYFLRLIVSSPATATTTAKVCCSITLYRPKTMSEVLVLS